MSSHTSAPAAATPKQLSYLRHLALQTGTTFVSPRTRQHASCEIDRLRILKGKGRVPFRREPSIVNDPAVYATAADSSEITGFGSSARWRTSPQREPESIPEKKPVGPLPATAHDTAGSGEPLELGRYETRAGEKRALYGIRVEGQPRIIDAAAEGVGRIYTVQRDLDSQDGYSAIKGIVADYIAQAQQLGRIPMATATD
ncbi:MAG: hypothetical protein ACHQC8_04495 [Solirubrobacterales bacterium]